MRVNRRFLCYPTVFTGHIRNVHILSHVPIAWIYLIYERGKIVVHKLSTGIFKFVAGREPALIEGEAISGILFWSYQLSPEIGSAVSVFCMEILALKGR